MGDKSSSLMYAGVQAQGYRCWTSACVLLPWSPALQGLREEEEPACSPEHPLAASREDPGPQPGETCRLSHAETRGSVGEGNSPSSPQPHGQEMVEPRHPLARAESLCEGSASLG